MFDLIKRNWFMLGLLAVAAVTIADGSGVTTTPGLWLRAHHGPSIGIVVIFFLSGLALDIGQVKSGAADYKGTLVALAVIFVASPLIALLSTLLPLQTGIVFGMLLVAVMPTTLSSGVVMTGAAGGNMAHALMITIIANSLAVVTIPVVLGELLALSGESRAITIARLPIMIKIATLVLLPLVAGLLVRRRSGKLLKPLLPYTSLCNQVAILSFVWMAVCQGRHTILSGLDAIVPVLSLVFTFHLSLLLLGFLATHAAGIGPGRRESVIFMGGQKTLPLSIILQVSLFPEYGLALVVCVLHHIVHLIMDAFLVQRLGKDRKT
ncbi:MAG: bile acid:sodium symporter [Desulfosarcinaceae bacterium]